MAFKDIRRQKLLSEAQANEYEDDLLYRIERATPRISNMESISHARRSAAWHVATSSLELLILHYTAGRPVAEQAAELPAVIKAFDVFIATEIPPRQKTPPRQETPPRNEAETLEITQHEAYVYVLWLLSLCRLLGHERLIPVVMRWIDRNAEYNRGRDGLFESIVEKLIGKTVPYERVLLHPAAYKPLAKATVVEPAERPAQVKAFLENWYKHMKPCYWWHTHTDKEGSSYFGYWAFEAALVTVLWDIDDSSYRDHMFYPKDLADWARGRAPISVGPPRTPGGQPCPQAGWWHTPAKADSRRYFKQDEFMPEIEGSAYGMTFWLWDVDQSAPKL